jgi:hypothetical protein
MAQDIYRKHEFVPGPIGRSWCDVTENGHLCGRLKSHPIHDLHRPVWQTKRANAEEPGACSCYAD